MGAYTDWFANLRIAELFLRSQRPGRNKKWFRKP
jgi:hypothetical protein